MKNNFFRALTWVGGLALTALVACQNNHPPRILGTQYTLVIHSKPVAYVLTVNAEDEDGDTLDITWTCASGDFPEGSTSEKVRWIPPLSAKAREYSLSVTVTDGEYPQQETILVPVEASLIYEDFRDGKVYPIVRIGSQTWMAANIQYETLHGSRCYRNDTVLCKQYGRLYDWQAALAACPYGWHLPSLDEWLTLFEVASPDPGLNLKSRDGWFENGNGLDAMGFAILPSGRWYSAEGYGHAGRHASLWASDELDENNARYVRFDYYSDDVSRFHSDKWSGFSARCIQD
ncbi:MAG TPA: hypothetical protein DC042_07485 [Bacteroidales bacterium]|nr:hypothetical protein [Bacteroidales bacterium]